MIFLVLKIGVKYNTKIPIINDTTQRFVFFSNLNDNLTLLLF